MLISSINPKAMFKHIAILVPAVAKSFNANTRTENKKARKHNKV